jgi:hypothetical protein
MPEPDSAPANYNPAAAVFAVLAAADRPLDIHAVRKALPKMPEGTVSSSLSKLRDFKAIERNTGTRPAVWRAVVRTLPAELQTGRLSKPIAPGLTRNRAHGPRIGKAGDLLVTLPVGKRETMTVTERDARALYAALGRLFGKGGA